MRTDGWTDGRTGMPELIVASRSFANASKRKRTQTHPAILGYDTLCYHLAKSWIHAIV
jgi:hypothetical protein